MTFTITMKCDCVETPLCRIDGPDIRLMFDIRWYLLKSSYDSMTFSLMVVFAFMLSARLLFFSQGNGRVLLFVCDEEVEDKRSITLSI